VLGGLITTGVALSGGVLGMAGGSPGQSQSKGGSGNTSLNKSSLIRTHAPGKEGVLGPMAPGLPS
jgi:hypothetical protein